MKKYLLLLKTFFQLRLEYRGDMVIYSITSVLTPIIGLALWLTTSTHSTTLPFNNYQLIAYFIAIMFVGVVTETWQAWFINESINNGNFSSFLIKPLSVFTRYVTENLSDKAFKLMILSIILIIVSFYIPKNFFDSISVTSLSILLFLITLVIGYLIAFFIELSIGLSSVWLYEIGFLKYFMDITGTFFGGRFVPLAFLPSWLGVVAAFFPFRYTISFPVEVLFNKVGQGGLFYGLVIDFLWLLVSFFVYRIILYKFGKNYQGYGA